MSEMREVATGLRFPEGPVALPDGSFLVLEIAAGHLTRVSASGEKSRVADLGGGPNGAAIGPDGRCYVCNNGGMRFHTVDGMLAPGHACEEDPPGWIEAVDLRSARRTVLYRECDGRPLRAPNDLVFDADGGLWFTDHGKSTRYTRDRGAVYYARPDGSLIRRVAAPLDGPNGIGLSPDGACLYVAETHTGRLWAYDVTGPGEVARTGGTAPWAKGELLANPPGYHLLDSLAVDAGGHVVVGSIPGSVEVISPDGAILESIAMPDPYPTNICFGGPELRTAYITLSGSGRLVAMDWPRPGLALHFQGR